MERPFEEHLRENCNALRDAGNARRSDVIAVEEPLEIRLMRDGLPEADENGGTGRSISVTMRTPGHDAELAVGFLYGEGLLRTPRDVVGTGHCGPTGNILRVTVRADLPLDLARLTRNFYATSSCGVCGKASIEAVTANAPPKAAPMIEPIAAISSSAWNVRTSNCFIAARLCRMSLAGVIGYPP